MKVIHFDPKTERLHSELLGMDFADRPYQYSLEGTVESHRFAEQLASRETFYEGQEWRCQGIFPSCNLWIEQKFETRGAALVESFQMANVGSEHVHLTGIQCGFRAGLAGRSTWRLTAIPFRIQLDGSLHDYSGTDLAQGNAQNAVYTDPSRVEPPIMTDGLWSEAWAWGDGERGLVIIKYNSDQIELAVVAASHGEGEPVLRFGGVGFSLYGEPTVARNLRPGDQVRFGQTIYIPFQGGLQNAFYVYRNFLESQGHQCPPRYNPPLNWNVLYDVGWHHSNAEMLKKYYTRAAILEEAEKAKEVGCNLLYLDPGWEITEGTTQWDTARLGPVGDLVHTLKQDFGLDLGYRTILRTYKPHWEQAHLVHHPDTIRPDASKPPFFEPCLCSSDFWQKKLERILEISRHGIRFMMFDEMDWRGPCVAEHHGHPTPTDPQQHALAVYRLAREVRRQCPDLVTEVHDPIWPWHTAVYTPTYYQQGAEGIGCYDENWGFEYMWNCIDDLKSGRAMALYYYNLACSIPLYLHITMAADNDHAVFFWWAASTIRHLGIGGAMSHQTIEPPGGLPSYDKARRFATYREQVARYQTLKPFFARGTFLGIDEHIHLHVLPNHPGGVIVVFNLTEHERTFDFTVPRDVLGSTELPVTGAVGTWAQDTVRLQLSLPAMAPGLIVLGDIPR